LVVAILSWLALPSAPLSALRCCGNSTSGNRGHVLWLTWEGNHREGRREAKDGDVAAPRSRGNADVAGRQTV
jgi:hypothetical protein